RSAPFRHSAPSGNAVGVALDLQSMPMHGGRRLQSVDYGDTGWPSAFQKQRRTRERHRIAFRLGAMLQNKSHRRLVAVAVRRALNQQTKSLWVLGRRR